MKRLAYGLSVAAVLTAAACGSTSSSSPPGAAPSARPSQSVSTPAGNGVEHMSAAQATRAAVTALKTAQSVRIRSTGTSDDKPMTVDLRLTGSGGTGTVSIGGSDFHMTVVGKDYYMMGPARAWKAAGSPEGAAAMLSGRWVKVPSSYGGPDESFTLDALTSQMSHHMPVAGTVATATLGGRDVALITYPDGTRLYVSPTGTPYPLRLVKTGSDGAQVDFSEFGAPVHITPPKGAIDMTGIG